MDETGSPYQEWRLSEAAMALTRRVLLGHTLRGDEPGADELISRGIVMWEPWSNRYVGADLEALQRRVHAEHRAQIADVLHRETTADRFFQEVTRIKDERTPGVVYASNQTDVQGPLQAAVLEAKHLIRTAHPITRPAESLEISLHTDIPRLQQGIGLRTIYPDSARSRAPEREYAKKVSEYGAELRTIAGDFIRCIIVDDALAVISDYRSLPPDRNKGFVITHPGMVALIIQVFDTQWALAAPWMGERTRTGDGDTVTTPRSREILRRFARGQTIKQIATGMTLSVATINGEIANLYDQTGTSSHFELGAWWARSEEQRLP